MKIYELHSCENQSVIYFYRRCRRCDRLPMLRTDRECEVRTLRSAVRCDDSTTLFTNIFRRPLSPGSQLAFLACQKIENISHFLSFSAGGQRAAQHCFSVSLTLLASKILQKSLKNMDPITTPGPGPIPWSRTAYT